MNCKPNPELEAAILSIIDVVEGITDFEKHIYKSVKQDKKTCRIVALENGLSHTNTSRIVSKVKWSCIQLLKSNKCKSTSLIGKYTTFVQISIADMSLTIPAFMVTDSGASLENFEAKIDLHIRKNLKIEFIKTKFLTK